MKILAIRVYASLVNQTESKDKSYVAFLIDYYNDFSVHASVRFKNCVADALVLINYPGLTDPLAETVIKTLESILKKSDGAMKDEQHEYFERNIDCPLYLLETFSRNGEVSQKILESLLNLLAILVETQKADNKPQLKLISQVLQTFDHCLKISVKKGEHEWHQKLLDQFFNLLYLTTSSPLIEQIFDKEKTPAQKVSRAAVREIFENVEASSIKSHMNSKQEVYLKELENGLASGSKALNLFFFYAYLRELNPTSYSNKILSLLDAHIKYIQKLKLVDINNKIALKTVFTLSNKIEDTSKAVPILESLMKSEYPLFDRLAIYSAILKGLVEILLSFCSELFEIDCKGSL